MTEEEFDAFMPNRPFRHDDLKQVEADAGRLTTLGLALWGITPADLERQLDASHPKIPAGLQIGGISGTVWPGQRNKRSGGRL